MLQKYYRKMFYSRDLVRLKIHHKIIENYFHILFQEDK